MTRSRRGLLLPIGLTVALLILLILPTYLLPLLEERFEHLRADELLGDAEAAR